MARLWRWLWGLRPQLIPWRRVNWDALALHAFAGLLAAIGEAGISNHSILEAVKAWAFLSLIYAGAFIQNTERKELPNDPGIQDTPDPPDIPKA